MTEPTPMLDLRYKPAPPLSSCIDCLWYRGGTSSNRKRQTALPTGGVDVTFNLSGGAVRVFADASDSVGESFEGAVVHGAHSRYFVLGARSDVHEVHVVGVHFRPGGAALLGLHGDELTNSHALLADVWGREGLLLHESLSEAPTARAKFQILEHAMLRRLQAARLVHPAVSFAVRRMQTDPAAARVATLQAETGYGARRFNTLFKNDIGLAPKLFSRIVRMRALVENIARGTRVDWADLAAQCGYYDQAHLTHDFREFTGVTPTAYRPVSPQSPLHMEIGD
jgi:AraC-like DNA-binding protein